MSEEEQRYKYWLERAIEVAHGQGLGVIGFVVRVRKYGLEFEGFSSPSLKQEQFVELVALAARQMIGDAGETVN